MTVTQPKHPDSDKFNSCGQKEKPLIEGPDTERSAFETSPVAYSSFIAGMASF